MNRMTSHSYPNVIPLAMGATQIQDPNLPQLGLPIRPPAHHLRILVCITLHRTVCSRFGLFRRLPIRGIRIDLCCCYKITEGQVVWTSPHHLFLCFVWVHAVASFYEVRNQSFRSVTVETLSGVLFCKVPLVQNVVCPMLSTLPWFSEKHCVSALVTYFYLWSTKTQYSRLKSQVAAPPFIFPVKRTSSRQVQYHVCLSTT